MTKSRGKDVIFEIIVVTVAATMCIKRADMNKADLFTQTGVWVI